jgi:hypothetical protein
MIFTSEIEEIVDWVNANRPDKESDKPYFEADQVDGGYELPEDGLILKGLDELNLNYFINRDINSVMVQVEFPSKVVSKVSTP